MSGDRENVALRRAEVVIQVSHEHLNRVWYAADWHGRGYNKYVINCRHEEHWAGILDRYVGV